MQETKGIGYTEDGKLTCAQKEVMPILNENIVSMNISAFLSRVLDYLRKKILYKFFN